VRKEIEDSNVKERKQWVKNIKNGKNEIYFSVRDNILQKRLRKLDIVEIKK